jgi:hypothetical protein
MLNNLLFGGVFLGELSNPDTSTIQVTILLRSSI